MKFIIKNPNVAQALDRYAQIGELANRVRDVLNQFWTPMLAIIGIEILFLFYTGNPGASGFLLMALGCFVQFAVWRTAGIGLPVTPMIALQNLLVYGLPIVTNHPIIHTYRPEFLFSSGLEVLIFSCAYSAAWRAGMQGFAVAPPVSYALPDFQHGSSTKVKRLGLTLVIAGLAYQMLDRLALLEIFFNLLPLGSRSLIFPLVIGANTCGMFLLSLFVGSGEFNVRDRTTFWALLTAACVINASTFMLSGTTTLVISVFVGLFWSSGRVPWRYLLVVSVIISFFNLGKFTMRDRYWQVDDDNPEVAIGLAQMPAVYAEWTQASLAALTSSPDADLVGHKGQRGQGSEQQSLLERINNLQNLLFVIDAVEVDRITPIEGASYSLILPLLVPRIMWPDKPRSHEGQVLLNVHFGRQDLNSTYRTYVAWGLIPEAYGNYGAVVGSVLLGAVMGFAFAWVEAFTARKLLLSLEGFLSFIVLLNMANSYEMVASVLVTTTFQAMMPIIFVSMPFLRRMQFTRPSAAPA